MSSSTAQWQRWWPLRVAVFLTALSFVIQPAPVRGLPPVMVAFVAILVFGGVWGLLEMIAQQFRQVDGKRLAVYPLHQGYAAVTSRPLAWLLTMTAVNTIVSLAVALALLVATGVLLALIVVRRLILGFLSALVFAVLLAFSGRLHVTPPAVYALIYGVGLVVVAGAVWWCRRHPRSIDPRTENRSA